MYEKVVVMHKNMLVVTIILLGIELNAYNIGYEGNDASVSYETSWGKERFVKEDYIRYFPYYKKWIEDYSKVDDTKIDLKKLPFPYCKLSKF